MHVLAPFRPLLRGWLLSALGWGCFFLLLGAQISTGLSMPWMDVVRMLLPGFVIWTVLTPLIFRLVERLPVERLLPPVWLVYLALGFVLTAALEIQRPDFRDRRAEGTPRRAGPGFWTRVFVGPNLPIYLVLVSSAHALLFYRRGQERERRTLELGASLAQARLQALRMQLQPHFLFNALNALAALIPEDPERAEEMLEALSDFLRLTLQTDSESEIPLAHERLHLDRYLAIEKIRFADRLETEIRCAPDLDRALVPPLLLQPLVENAVRHGIEPRPGKGEPGRIEIDITTDAGDLRIVIRDNGVGLRADATDGVGLANTRARLHELYGANASIELTHVGGTQVDIHLPLRRIP